MRAARYNHDDMTRIAIAAVLGTVLATGCAAQRYQPAPVAPDATASEFQARTLADPALRSFEESCLGHPLTPWPPQPWEFQTLSLAALYFNPALDEARARIAGSQAALVTAAARPNPTFSITPGIPSPYLLSADLSFPLETGGKRGYRIQAARSLDQAARFDLADSAWTIRRELRSALLDYLLASENLDLLRSEAKVRGDQVTILDQRFSAGEIPRLEAELARAELSRTRLAVIATEGQVEEARAALAAAIGIPAAGLRDARFSWEGMNTPPGTDAFTLQEIQRDAVLNRLDVRSALARYAAAEAGLQLEIAKQYPDIDIGPGYTYEEGHSFFTVGFTAVIPLFDRNQGPIAEAEAHRQEAAAAFMETQARVIARSERALAVYGAALKELAEAEYLVKLQGSQGDAIQQSVRAGEQDRLDLNEVQIQSSVAARARLEALARAQKALGELEDAVQRPLAPGGELTMSPESPALNMPRN